MARNVNVTIFSERDGTRNNVPDWRIDLDVSWIDRNGESKSKSTSEHFLLLLNWLRTNYPRKFREMAEDLAFRIARAKHDVDDIGDWE